MNPTKKWSLSRNRRNHKPACSRIIANKSGLGNEIGKWRAEEKQPRHEIGQKTRLERGLDSVDGKRSMRDSNRMGEGKSLNFCTKQDHNLKWKESKRVVDVNIPLTPYEVPLLSSGGEKKTGVEAEDGKRVATMGVDAGEKNNEVE